MTTRETISKLYESLTIENIRGLNQKMLRLLSRKINCYEQYGKKPDEYYRCFESIEKEAAKDHSILIKREE